MQCSTPTISFGFSKHEATLFSLIAGKELNGNKFSDSNNYSFNITLEQIARHNLKNISQDFIDSLRKTVSLIASRKIILSDRKAKDGLIIMPIFAKLEISDHVLSITFNNSCFSIIVSVINGYPSETLIDILRLSSLHSIRLYQLLYNQSKRTLSLDDLRAYLGLTNCYKRYYSFKHDVIIASQKEINVKTNLYLEFKEIKNARKVNQIEFTLTKLDSFVGNNRYKWQRSFTID